MTDTPIKDAFREKFPDLWRPSDKFDKAIWMLSARACLAQVKPFLDAYLAQTAHEYQPKDKYSSDCVICGVFTNGRHHPYGINDSALDDAYQACVAPLLKELEE